MDQALTTLEYPTIFVFVPYTPSEISRMEFIVLDDRERDTIYHAEITQAPTPGVIEIQVPPEIPYRLAINTSYRWYFMLSCEGETSRGPHLVLDGWIHRTSDVINLSEPVDHNTFLQAGLWYDAISHVASLYAVDSSYQEKWYDILLDLGYEDISGFPLIDSSASTLK